MNDYQGFQEETDATQSNVHAELGPKEMILDFVSKDEGTDLTEDSIIETFSKKIDDQEFLVLGLNVNNKILYYGTVTTTPEGKTLHKFVNSSNMAKELLKAVNTGKYLENAKVTKINEYNGDRELVITDGNTIMMIPEKGEPYKHAMSD